MPRVSLAPVAKIVGVLAFVEFVSGVLQGYYVPMMTDIARHLEVHDADVNWLEGSQLMFSALCVPAFAKLGDMVGHRRMLLWSTAITAVATAALPFTDSFALFLTAWAVQGAYVAWLPLEIALIWSRTRGIDGRSLLTAKAAGVLVAALESGAIVGALLGGALVDAVPLLLVLLVPAVFVVACFVVVLVGAKESPDLAGGRLDLVGLVLVSAVILAFTGGLSLLRLGGLGDPLAWAVIVVALLLVIPFARHELRHPDPIIDVRMFRSPALAPVFLTSALTGMAILGAQAPLSTFARTDPAEVGYGLGTTGFTTSLIVGCYLVGMITGALLYPLVARRTAPRVALILASALVSLGFFMFLPFHDTAGQVTVNMVVAGVGSGALVASLPATAAAAAPRTQTGVATGLVNTSRTVGGAIASAIFGMVLLQRVSEGAGAGAESTAGSFSGYVTVWVVCGGAALVSTLLLAFVVPKQAFRSDADKDRAEGAPAV